MWSVIALVPPGYPHAAAYRPVAQALWHALRRLDPAAAWRENQLGSGPSVYFGAHLLAPGTRLPDPAVIFNLEQYDPASPWFQAAYVDQLRRHPVWDFSRSNAAALRAVAPTAQYVPLPVPPHPPVPPRPWAARDLDVLFYGSLNPRRVACLQACQALGLRVQSVSGAYGPALVPWLARARVVLNCHFYAAARLEWPRVLPLLAQGVPVVSEWPHPDDLEPGLAEAVAFAAYEALPAACAALARDAAAWQAYADRARAWAADWDPLPALAAAWRALAARHPHQVPSPPA